MNTVSDHGTQHQGAIAHPHRESDTASTPRERSPLSVNFDRRDRIQP